MALFTHPSRAAWDLSKHALKPLMPRQKTALSCIAKNAFKVAESRYATDDLSFEAWRHREARAATATATEPEGVTISTALNKHYRPLHAHFSLLAGDAATAFEDHLADTPEDEGKRIAMHAIQAHLDRGRLPMAYAATICKNQFGTSLAHATAAQLQSLAMTVKRAVQRKRKKEREHPCPPAKDGEAKEEVMHVACEWTCSNCGQIETSELDRDQHECPNLGD